jgi:acetyl esterase
MPLDPEVARYLQSSLETDTGETEAPSLAEQRCQAIQAVLAEAGEPEAVASVEDRVLPGPAGSVPVRLSTPVGAEGVTRSERIGQMSLSYQFILL